MHNTNPIRQLTSEMFMLIIQMLNGCRKILRHIEIPFAIFEMHIWGDTTRVSQLYQTLQYLSTKSHSQFTVFAVNETHTNIACKPIGSIYISTFFSLKCDVLYIIWTFSLPHYGKWSMCLPKTIKFDVKLKIMGKNLVLRLFHENCKVV